MLVDEAFQKALGSLYTYVLVNNNLYGKLVSSLGSPTSYHKKFKVNSVPFFISDFNLLSCELEILHLKCYIESFCVDII